MYSGPHIKRDGLVFGYDTGYGVANKSIATRHYKGKPTENLLTIAGSDAEIERSGTSYPYYSVNINSVVQSRWSASNNQLTISFEGKRDYVGGGTGGGNDGYPVFYVYFTDWSWASTKSITSYDWTLGTSTFTMPNPSGKTVYFSIYHMNSGNRGRSYSRKHSLEFNSIKTPFINGTRSSTQSLIDLTRTTNIDVSNVSFDSTGQPTFDGTNDVITTSFPATTISNVTIEAVVYRNQATGRYEAIVQNNVVSDDALYINPSGYLMFWPCASSSLTVPTGQWSHVAVSYNGTTLTYIVNGTIQVVTATCSDITDWDFLRIGGHGTTDSERWIGKIAVAKVYEKSLSAAELTQNYRAYKNRFDI
jgi:hypothetical protein